MRNQIAYMAGRKIRVMMVPPQRPANQRIGERSPEDRMSERNERQDRRQRGQQNRAGALHRRLHHRVERIEPACWL